jgi:hypothetical protein
VKVLAVPYFSSYWLHSQLGYSMTEIIAKAGPTLEATFHALTGQSGAYTKRTQFLAPFVPIGETDGALQISPQLFGVTAESTKGKQKVAGTRSACLVPAAD